MQGNAERLWIATPTLTFPHTPTPHTYTSHPQTHVRAQNKHSNIKLTFNRDAGTGFLMASLYERYDCQAPVQMPDTYTLVTLHSSGDHASATSAAVSEAAYNSCGHTRPNVRAPHVGVLSVQGGVQQFKNTGIASGGQMQAIGRVVLAPAGLVLHSAHTQQRNT